MWPGLTPSLLRLSRSPPSQPSQPQMPESIPENFPGWLALSMLRGGAGLGSGSSGDSCSPATLGSRARRGDGLGGRRGARHVGARLEPPGRRPGAARWARGPTLAPRGPGSPRAPPRPAAPPGSPCGSWGGARADHAGKEGPPPASSCRTLVAELCLRWRRGGPFELGRLSEGGQGLSRMPQVFLSIWRSSPQSPRQGGTPQDFASRPVESRPET